MKSCSARWNPRKLGWNLRRIASDEIKSASTNPTKSDFIAKRFHPTQVGFLPPSADFVEKSTHCLGRQMCAFFWWGMVDSDHRSHRQQIYSLPPLAAREFPPIMELVIGVEPTTCWLQISCSAIEPHQHHRTDIIIAEVRRFVNTFFQKK